MACRRKKYNYSKECNLKKIFGIYKEPKIILCRVENYLPEVVKRCGNVASIIDKVTAGSSSSNKEKCSFESAAHRKRTKKSVRKSYVKNKNGIYKDAKGILCQDNNINLLLDSQRIGCSAKILGTGDMVVKRKTPSKKEQKMDPQKIRLKNVIKEGMKNVDLEKRASMTKKISMESSSFWKSDISGEKNPMDLDETIREERILKLKELLKQHNEAVDAIRRKRRK